MKKERLLIIGILGAVLVIALFGAIWKGTDPLYTLCTAITSGLIGYLSKGDDRREEP